ncbi:MAG TPA: ATP-binding protein [Gemmatimonadaceae bacterium]|nr:ATP-binding protein [Gemmatimonadaceae bacterium]
MTSLDPSARGDAAATPRTMRILGPHDVLADADAQPAQSEFIDEFADLLEATGRDALLARREVDERLRLAVESARIGTFDFDPRSGRLEWSDRCKEILGFPFDEEISYASFLEGICSEDRERVGQAVVTALDPYGDGALDVEYRIVLRDGASRWVIAKGRAIFAGAGPDRAPVRFIGTILDNTERHRHEERATLLADAAAALGASLDDEVMLLGMARSACRRFASAVLVDVVADDGGRIERRIALERAPQRSMLMSLARNLAPEPIRRGAGDPATAAIRDQRTVRLDRLADAGPEAARPSPQYELLRELGAHSLIAAPLVARGRALGAVTFLRYEGSATFDDADLITAEELADRTATAIDNAQLYHAAVAANEAKSHFLASMSHELRTPLTAIIGYEELLADGITGPITEPQRQQLGRIKASASHLLSLIDEILTFARVESGSEWTQIEPVWVTDALEEAAALVAPLVGDRGLTLVVKASDDGIAVRTDRQKIRQILVNLLSNATKFTEEGTISLEACRDGREVCFRVSDTGIGIAPEHVAHIFEPFWQVEQRATRRIAGTGLGLTVSRRLAQLLGGDLTVVSRVGAGSIFSLRLPLDA